MPERLRRIAVIGHPLAAEENRLAFQGWDGFHVDLIVPLRWSARSLGHTYPAPAISSVPHPAPSHRETAQPTVHPLATIASGRNSFFLWMGLGPLLQRLRPDALYCWEEPWCLSTWQVARQAARLAHGMGIPLFFYSAENRPKYLPWPFSALQRQAFARYRACIVPTQEISARIRTSGFPGVVHLIPLWIRARRGLRADAAARALAYVGRLIPLKRVHLLIEGLGLLPGYTLRIIGDGPARPGLEALADALGLAPRVEFLGHVGNEGLEAALAGTSLLVVPTAENPRQAEQFGKAAVEGVSLGLPVLASRTGNLAALAGRFPTLIACDLDTPAQLAEAVTALFAAYPGEAALARSRLQAESEYGHQAVSLRLQAAFRETLDAAAEEPAP